MKTFLAFSCLVLIFIALPLFPVEVAQGLSFEESKVYGYNSTRLIWSQARSRKTVALTIDDGPNRYTEDILRILDRYRVRATFFLIGNQVSRHVDIVARMTRAGHEVGNHSYAHSYTAEMTLEEMKRDIYLAEKAILEASGRVPLYFRPPGGIVSETVKRASGVRGYSIMLWDVDSRDWALRDQSLKIVDNVLEQTRPGSIILLHSLPQTVEALPVIIDELQRRGYAIVPASELLRF